MHCSGNDFETVTVYAARDRNSYLFLEVQVSGLNGKNAIVTGASYGIGPEVARALAEQGARVVLAARTIENLQKVAAQLQEEGYQAIAVPVDIMDPLGREALVAQAGAELGPTNILVNCAGSFNGGRLHVRSEEDLQADLHTNLTAPIMLTRRILPDMLRRKEGHLVHVASLAGKAGIPYFAAYSASKYGLVGFNQCLQGELRGTGVHSSAVILGFVKDTGMWARLNRKVHPAFGLSSPEEVARAVVRAIRSRKVEVIVNPLPVRPAVLLWALAPGMAGQLFRLLRIDEFAKGIALQVEADAAMERNSSRGADSELNRVTA